MSDPSIGGFSPLVITPQMRQAQAQRMERVQQTLETGPTVIPNMDPSQAMAQTSYYSQVQSDIGQVRTGPFPALPPVPGFA